MTNPPNQDRTARAEEWMKCGEFVQAVIRKISIRDAMVAACASALTDREEHRRTVYPTVSGEASRRRTLKRLDNCGMVVDTKYAVKANAPMTAAELRAFRHRLGLTQPALAEALGVSRSRIADYESGGPRAQAIPRVVELACEAIEHQAQRLSSGARRVSHRSTR